MTLGTLNTMIQAISPEIHVDILTARPLVWLAFGLTHLRKQHVGPVFEIVTTIQHYRREGYG